MKWLPKSERAVFRAWSSQEILRASELRRAGWSYDAIGTEIQRSVDAVGHMLRRMGTFPSGNAPRWSPDDQQRAVEMRRAGMADAAIGAALGRTASAVNAVLCKLRQEGHDVPAVSSWGARRVEIEKVKRTKRAKTAAKKAAAMDTRECRSCQRQFLSEWIGNRVCTPCKSSEAWQSATW